MISLAGIFCQFIDCPIQYHDGIPDIKRDALSSEPEKFETTMMNETEIDEAKRRCLVTNLWLTTMMKDQDSKKNRTK